MVTRSAALLFCLILVWQCRSAGLEETSSIQSDQGDLDYYEATRILSMNATRDCRDYKAKYGIEVTERDGSGNATRGKIRVLSDNTTNSIAIIGAFNDWGAAITDEDRLSPVSGTPDYEGVVRSLKHGMEYRLLLNGEQVLDPAAKLFTTEDYYRSLGRDSQYLNSVFWDFDRPNAYKMQTFSVDLRHKAAIIAESEVHALAAKWKSGNQVGPGEKHRTYRFVEQSGVIRELSAIGYNAIEFLPFNASVDGDSWHFRYQVFGLYAPESRYGNPDDFMRMMDEFNRQGIAVIMDAVVGHYPYRANQGVRKLENIGIHRFKKTDGRTLFGQVGSPWGTYRYDYANPYMRAYLIDSIMFMVCQYGVSGIRFDNLDGIKDYEEGGGDIFLKDLVRTMREYRPESLLIGEMFFGNNSVMKRNDHGGFGINFRTHSDYFDFLKDNTLLRTEDINIGKLRDAIRNPWHWKEAPRVQYLTNHDEAANRRDGATGKYPASLFKNGGWHYSVNKSKVFGSLSMLSASAYLDMPQLRLLQEGSFYSNPAVDWGLLRHESQKGVYRYFADLSRYMRHEEAFAFKNFHKNIENHWDAHHGHRVFSVYRKGPGRDIIAVFNLGHQSIDNYRVGIPFGADRLRIAIDSTQNFYAGNNEFKNRYDGTHLQVDRIPWQGKGHSINIPVLAPYATIVLEK